jgi:hypothetical protein
LPALRRHALATAWPVESIDRAPSTTNATRSLSRTTGPTAGISITAQRASHRRPGCWSSASLEVFESPATLTGCARAVRGGQPPDDPASAFPSRCVGPRVLFKATCRPDDFVVALAVFRWSGFLAMKLAWRTFWGQSVPTESVARAAREPNGPEVRPCRRVDDLLLRPLRLRSHAQVRSGKPILQALCVTELARHLASRHTGRRRFT